MIMSIVFLHIQWLWGLAAIPMLWMAVIYSRAIHGTRLRILVTLLRSLVVALAVISLARPVSKTVSRVSPAASITFVSDESRSMQHVSEERDAKISEYENALRSFGHIERIRFTRSAWTPEEVPSTDNDGTNIECGLESARAAITGNTSGIVLLFSDGQATAGDAVRAAERLRAQGGGVYAVPVGKQGGYGPRIVGVEPPSRVMLGQTAEFHVRIRTDYESLAEVRLLNSAGVEIDRVKVTIQSDGIALLRYLPQKSGFENCSVYLAGRQEIVGEQTIVQSPIYVEGNPRILIVDTVAEEARYLALALKHMPLEIATRGLDESFPPYQELMGYEAIILNDCAELPESNQNDLVRYVEEAGGGLIFIGGSNVRTAIWQGSLLEKALPIDFAPEPVKVVERSEQVHVCFVLDKSGSMAAGLGASSAGTVSKIDMLKAAVHRCVAELPPDAIVSVVVFDSATVVLIRSAKAAEWANVAGRIDSLLADGGTIMDEAIEQAINLLAACPHPYMILLTDGLTQLSVSQSPKVRWDQLIHQLRSAKIRLAAIALGTEADRDLLDNLAMQTGGMRYDCESADEIPQVFIKEAQTIKQLARESSRPFIPVPGPFSHMIRGMTIETFPELAKSLPTVAKKVSQVVLLNNKQEPLLALWQHGLGSVAVFASDVKPVWARQWLTWPELGRYWGQVLNWVIRSSNRIAAQVEPIVEGKNIRLLISATDNEGKPAVHLAPSGTLFTATGENANATLSWREISPAVYEARGTLTDTTNYLCHIQLKSQDTTVFTHTLMIRPATSSEMARPGTDIDALRAIAVAGGGILNPSPEEIMSAASKSREQVIKSAKELWPYFVLVALILWLFDVGFRRMATVNQAGLFGRLG